MPTFNQLVRKGRKTSVKKSTAPALQKGFNSLKKKATDIDTIKTHKNSGDRNPKRNVDDANSIAPAVLT